MGVIEARQNLGFRQKRGLRFGSLLFVLEVLRHFLQGPLTGQTDVAGQVDRAHTTFTEHFLDAVATLHDVSARQH